MEVSFYTLQIGSTLSAAFPLLLATRIFKVLNLPLKLFTGLLVVGFITDLMGWYFYLSSNASANLMVRYGYNLIEPIVTFWILSELSTSRVIKYAFSKAWVVVIPFWLLSIHYKIFELFKTTTETLIAFISCFCLLNLVERVGLVTHQPVFWILLGLFFYNFTTFFFMSLISSQIGLNLWYLHNIINIITNLIYAVGFWKLLNGSTISPK